MTEHNDGRTSDPLSGRLSRRTALRGAGAVGIALAGAAHLSRSSASASQSIDAVTPATPSIRAPTAVIVHGPFADGARVPSFIPRSQSRCRMASARQW